jgi:hypothetical protein
MWRNHAFGISRRSLVDDCVGLGFQAPVEQLLGVRRTR